MFKHQSTVNNKPLILKIKNFYLKMVGYVKIVLNVSKFNLLKKNMILNIFFNLIIFGISKVKLYIDNTYLPRNSNLFYLI